MNDTKKSVFRNVDLHVHTPKSICYSERSVTPEQIVATALTRGLEVIAITDHNTTAAIDIIRSTAEKKGLFVFPGMELSAGEGHILAIFDLNTRAEKLEAFLDGIGITSGGWGDAATVARISMEGIFQRIEEWEGIAIAAHIERWPSGFLEAKGSCQTKARIHNNKYLSALEITIPQNKSLWENGQMSGYPKKYPCIQGSDAHALSEIGRRSVRIEMPEINLRALRLAFLNYQAKIIFADGYNGR